MKCQESDIDLSRSLSQNNTLIPSLSLQLQITSFKFNIVATKQFCNNI
jgi:hypothetical protein